MNNDVLEDDATDRCINQFLSILIDEDSATPPPYSPTTPTKRHTSDTPTTAVEYSTPNKQPNFNNTESVGWYNFGIGKEYQDVSALSYFSYILGDKRTTNDMF